MNIDILNTYVSNTFTDIRPDLDAVFAKTKTRAALGRKTNIKTFVRDLTRILKPHRVRVYTEVQDSFRAKSPSLQWYPPLGGYCYESITKPSKIDIVLCTHASSNRLDLTQDGWHYFQYRFYKTLLHEMVHRAQFANGKRATTLVFRPHSHASQDKYQFLEQKYLGEIDEVEAYAHDCVEEWHFLFPQTPLTIRGLKRDFRGSRRLPSLSYYYDVFQGDETHPAVQRLFRKVHAWNDVMTPLVESLPFSPISVRVSPKNKGLAFVLE